MISEEQPREHALPVCYAGVDGLHADSKQGWVLEPVVLVLYLPLDVGENLFEVVLTLPDLRVVPLLVLDLQTH